MDESILTVGLAIAIFVIPTVIIVLLNGLNKISKNTFLGAIFNVIASVVNYNFTVQKKNWQAFATANDLNFQYNFKSGSTVSGIYQGYFLNINSYLEKTLPFTKITLEAENDDSKNNNNHQPASSEDMDTETLKPLVTYNLPRQLTGKLTINPKTTKVTYLQEQVITDSNSLWLIANVLVEIATNAPLLLNVQSQAVPYLYKIATNPNHRLRFIATQLLEEIAIVTTAQFSDRTSIFVCLNCLVYIIPHNLELSSLQTITYYGCRKCGQSKNYAIGTIVAVLDNQLESETWQTDQKFYINWSHRRTLFDFDEVEIIQATDEDVERFAVQLGNDTDIIRKPKYPTMTCIIYPNCILSPNTIRILERTFGNIEYKSLLKSKK